MSGSASPTHSFNYKLQKKSSPWKGCSSISPKYVGLWSKPSITTKDRWLTVVSETVKEEEIEYIRIKE